MSVNRPASADPPAQERVAVSRIRTRRPTTERAPAAASPAFVAVQVSLREAWAIVERIPLGCRFVLRPVRSGIKRKRFGPYWFAEWRVPGESVRRAYVGSHLKRAIVEAAHARVAQVLEEARAAVLATEAGVALQKLEARARSALGPRKAAAPAPAPTLEKAAS